MQLKSALGFWFVRVIAGAGMTVAVILAIIASGYFALSVPNEGNRMNDMWVNTPQGRRFDPIGQEKRTRDRALRRIATSIVYGACSAVVAYGSRRARQSVRNGRAQRILRALREGKENKYCLLLRPFKSAGRLPKPELKGVPISPMDPRAYLWPVEDGFEAHVANALKWCGVTIALGPWRGVTGPGMISAEEQEWRDTANLLMAHARAVICIPSFHPGITWEVRQLYARRLLNRTVFIMPPDPKGEGGWEDEWDKTRMILGEHGIELPNYDPEGGLFKLNALGHLVVAEPLSMSNRSLLRRTLYAMFTGKRQWLDAKRPDVLI